MLSAPRIGALVTTALVLCGTLASCTATARISDVYMALDGNGDRQRTLFFTDTKEIHCVVEAGIGRKGVTIEALVRQLQAYDFVADKSFATDRVAANVEASPSPGDGIQKTDVDLKPSAPDGSDATGAPFPQGKFQCEAYLDGVLQQVALFDIVFADCPTATIQPATLCFGFYKQNTQCPRYGVTSRDPAQCRCSAAKGWECDP
jgi:hypothetical protein